MFVNLLAAIEADINQAAQKLQTVTMPIISQQEYNELVAKKQRLAALAMQYVGLENQYRELSGVNSIY